MVLAEPESEWFVSICLKPKLGPHSIYWVCLVTFCLHGKSLVIFKGELIFIYLQLRVTMIKLC